MERRNISGGGILGLNSRRWKMGNHVRDYLTYRCVNNKTLKGLIIIKDIYKAFFHIFIFSLAILNSHIIDLFQKK